MGPCYSGDLEVSYPQRGDVYWANVDLIVGAESTNRRPCVIISPDAANRSGPLVIVAPVTTGKGKKIHFHEIFLPKGTAGLAHDSKIKAFQLRCIDKKRLSQPPDRLPSGRDYQGA